MSRPIGLWAPFAALVCFGLIYNPYVTPHLSKQGIWETLLSPQIFFLLSTLAIVHFRHLSLSDIGLRRERLKTQLKVGSTIGLSPALLTIVIGLLLMAADSVVPFLPRPLLGGPAVPIRVDSLTLFMLIVLAPVSEELFFRGILLRALREHYSAPLAVILSALIFMGGHGVFAIGPLLLGLITAPLALTTRSVLPGMIFHAMANAYGPLLVTYFPNLYRYLDFFFQ